VGNKVTRTWQQIVVRIYSKWDRLHPPATWRQGRLTHSPKVMCFLWAMRMAVVRLMRRSALTSSQVFT
jgi:hypothetical protein